jgi:hypothetical protein
LSFGKLTGPNDCADNQDRSQDTAPRHSVPFHSAFWRKLLALVAITQFYPLRARAITAHGINQLSPKRFKRFWREFQKFYNFCGDQNYVRSRP